MNGFTSPSGKEYHAKCIPRGGTYVAPVYSLPEGVEISEATTTEAAGYVSKGNAYVVKKEFAKAIAEFSRALKALPDDVFALRGRGDAYEQMGDGS